jgi:hypothetical protein
MNDIARARAKHAAERTLLVEAIGKSPWGVVVALVAALCALGPGVLFVRFGPGNTYLEIAVAMVFAALALALAIAVPARIQDRIASRRLAALGTLPGFSVARYRELLSRARIAGRVVANVKLAAEVSEARRHSLADQLAGWHLDWDGPVLLAETDELSGQLLLDMPFKSSGAPAAVFTNAAFHARFAALIAVVGQLGKLASISVDIVDEVAP